MKKDSFKVEHSFEKRKSESQRILEKFPDRVPVIVEIDAKSDKLPPLDKHKYLVPKDLSVGQFMYVIRKRMKLKSEKAIYLFFKNTLAPTADIMGNVYSIHKDVDEFLYANVSGQNTFGGNFTSFPF